ncbi:MAG: hypothetical protein JW850_09325, partial [Thermoflexales bacterium]|nr:hypothetical protein [Thermoflexales bacterium]
MLAHNTFALAALAAPSGRLYDSTGTPVDIGSIQVTPRLSTAVALAQGSPLHITLSGTGIASFYAPALSGLGAGTNWLTYTAQLTSTQPYTLELRDVVVTVNGTDTYTGNFTLVTTGTTTLTGAGHTAAPNFAPSLSGQTQDAHITIGPATGTLLIGGEPLDASNGLALAGYTGPLTITEETTSTDRVELEGEASFFTLHLSPTAATTDPNTPVNFNALISANFTDTYTVTVEAPEGWNVEIDAAGIVTATPPLGAEPGDYAILVTAQSGTYPDLFVSALHTVTTTPYQGMAMRVNPDPLITVPMGEPASPLVGGTGGGSFPGDTNDGRAQAPGAAYTIDITNTSTTSHTFSISISSLYLPPGWLVLSGAEGQTATTLTLPPGGVGQVGLYISPTLAALLPPGASYEFSVTATALDDPALTQSQAVTFTMPEVAFSYVTAEPLLVYASPALTSSFDVALANVGNATGTFDVAVTLPVTTWVMSGGEYTAALGPGESDERALVFAPAGSALGDEEMVAIHSPAPGTPYTQTAYVLVRVVHPCLAETQRAARAAGTLGDTRLELALDNLVVQMDAWQVDPDDAGQQARVTDALNDVIARLRHGYPAIDTVALEALAASPTLDGFCSPASAVEDGLRRIGERGVTAAWTSGAAATLAGQALTYTLSLQNRGTLTSSYTVNLAGLPPAWVDWTSRTVDALPPGAGASLALVVTPAALGQRSFAAQVTAVEDGLAQALATASLNSVDAFVKVVAVSPEPAFVETGASSSTLSAQVANVANVYQELVARAQVLAPDGSVAWSAETPLALPTGALRSCPLGVVDTSAWAPGVYTVSVELLDALQQPVPGGAGYAYLVVGQALELSQAAWPAVVPPGTATVTSVITTQLLNVNSQTSTLKPRALLTADDRLPTAALTINNLQLTINNSSSSSRLPGLAKPLFQSAGSIRRVEEVSLTLTGAWVTQAAAQASGGQVARSNTRDNAATLVFSGTWVGVGFATSIFGGKADVRIDGVSQGYVDTYGRWSDVASWYYVLSTPGPHTLTIAVLNQKNPRAIDTQVYVDYVDVWDGVGLPQGTFEEDSSRVYLSSGWSRATHSLASGGAYFQGGSNAWFTFSGDSLTFHSLANYDGDEMALYLDGRYLAYVQLHATQLTPRTFHFDGLGQGPHVLQVSKQRGYPRIDAFSTPALQPAPVAPVIQRLEENHPRLRYNGDPFKQTAGTWYEQGRSLASGGYTHRSLTLGYTASLAFDGNWVAVGFHTRSDSGLAEIRLDGVAQETLDLYSLAEGVLERAYTVPTGTHTLDVAVLAQRNPASTNDWVELDYVDTWTGRETPPGRHEAEQPGAVYASPWWTQYTHPAASGGAYLKNIQVENLWFGFSGSSVAYVGRTSPSPSHAQVFIDGASYGVADLTYDFSAVTRTFQYTGLADGPHVLRLTPLDSAIVDAFDAPATPPASFPAVEWYDTAPAASGQDGGVLSTAAAGDLDGDGVVEIVVTSQNGHLYVYRGDGVDSGGGSPLLWSAYVGPKADGPALADLDGVDGAEIVVGSDDGLYAFHADGSLMWVTNTLASIWGRWENLGLAYYPQGGAAIANMDGDSAPEIVTTGVYTNTDDFELFVLEADGSIAWRYPLCDSAWWSGCHATPPVLADLSGDGRLDILTAHLNTLYLFDYAHDTIAWTRGVTAGLKVFGAPAVADVDGDGGPEIAAAWDGLVELLDADGSLVWSYHTGGDQPGSVAIADTDGDNQVEVIVSMRVDNGPGYWDGRVFVLNADGSLLWSALAGDEASGSGVSVHDLDGDGTWEVIWNGADQGLTIFRGSDGAVLFNEPLIDSGTILDYPIVADVDGDGHAEIVAGDHEGIYVVGCDAAWGPARPVWN